MPEKRCHRRNWRCLIQRLAKLVIRATERRLIIKIQSTSLSSDRSSRQVNSMRQQNPHQEWQQPSPPQTSRRFTRAPGKYIHPQEIRVHNTCALRGSKPFQDQLQAFGILKKNCRLAGATAKFWAIHLSAEIVPSPAAAYNIIGEHRKDRHDYRITQI